MTGPGNVVALDEHRGGSGYDGVTCLACGEAWFILVPPGPAQAPVVCVDLDGRITGYSAILACVNCGHRLPVRS